MFSPAAVLLVLFASQTHVIDFTEVDARTLERSRPYCIIHHPIPFERLVGFRRHFRAELAASAQALTLAASTR